MISNFALILSVLMVFFTAPVFAQKVSRGPSIPYSMPAVEVGFKWNSASYTNSISDKQEAGYQLGVSAVFDFTDTFALKSGMFYSERPFKTELTATTGVKGKITYFEVPLLLMMKFEDYAGAYIGPSIAAKLGDEATPANLTNIKSMIIPITFGAQFKFTSELGANVFFETVTGDIATNLSNSRAVGVNLLFALD